MNELFFVEHDTHMIGAFDSKEDQISRQNVLPVNLIACLVQLLGGNWDFETRLPIDIVDKTAAVKGIRTLRSSAIRFPQMVHCVLNDIFPNRAVRLVNRDLLCTAGEKNGDGQKKDCYF